MENSNRISYLNTLISAFESRNDTLQEEIVHNNEMLAGMREELANIIDNEQEKALSANQNG